MSEDKTDSTPTQILKKTSAVPLRKETVRVTLKADPKDSQGASAPPAPAPTVPLKMAGAPTAPTAAPTVQLNTGMSAPGPAPTVMLNTPSASGPATASLTAGPSTASLAGGSSQPLPKATVQLQQTQPMGAPAAPMGAGATIVTADDLDTAGARAGETLLTVFSAVALIAAIAALTFQLMTANIWVHDDPNNPGWAQLLE